MSCSCDAYKLIVKIPSPLVGGKNISYCKLCGFEPCDPWDDFPPGGFHSSNPADYNDKQDSLAMALQMLRQAAAKP